MRLMEIHCVHINLCVHGRMFVTAHIVCISTHCMHDYTVAMDDYTVAMDDYT